MSRPSDIWTQNPIKVLSLHCGSTRQPGRNNSHRKRRFGITRSESAWAGFACALKISGPGRASRVDDIICEVFGSCYITPI